MIFLSLRIYVKSILGPEYSEPIALPGDDGQVHGHQHGVGPPLVHSLQRPNDQVLKHQGGLRGSHF